MTLSFVSVDTVYLLWLAKQFYYDIYCLLYHNTGQIANRTKGSYPFPAIIQVREVTSWAGSSLFLYIDHEMLQTQQNSPVDFAKIRPIMNMQSVSPRRRKTGREAGIKAADSMCAVVRLFQVKEETL
jgi:hypothetical protein